MCIINKKMGKDKIHDKSAYRKSDDIKGLIPCDT